jgi:hypothetical protein
MSCEEKFNWKPETPGKLPAGARISAGKSGSVEMSLPSTAEVFVNCVPVNCMPSPESPAKRMVTVSNSSSCLSSCVVGGSMTVLIADQIIPSGWINLKNRVAGGLRLKADAQQPL